MNILNKSVSLYNDSDAIILFRLIENNIILELCFYDISLQKIYKSIFPLVELINNDDFFL